MGGTTIKTGILDVFYRLIGKKCGNTAPHRNCRTQRMAGTSVLCGTRADNCAICGPGGHVQEGESPIQAAICETQEEFGNPHIFLCTEYEGELAASDEILNPVFMPLHRIRLTDPKLFPPFATSFALLDKA